MLHSLFVQMLRAKLELSRIVAASLMETLDYPVVTDWEKREAFRQWADVTRDGDFLAFMLELLRRHEREKLRR